MKQLRGLGATSRALDAAEGGLWAISLDPPDTLRTERRARDLPGQFASASKEVLIQLGLLHRTRDKELASPATIVVDPDGRVAWTYYSTTVGDRPDTEVIFEQLDAWFSASATGPPGDAQASNEKNSVTDAAAEDVESHELTKRRLEEVADSLMVANEKIVELNEGLESLVASRTGALHAALAQTRAMLENMADGLVSVDRDGHVQAANPAFARLLMIPGIQVGSAASDVLPFGLLALVGRAIAQGTSATMELELPGGRVGAATASPIPHEDAGEPCVGSVLTLRDVTVEKKIDQMKTNFSTAVSHELRTPLTSVLGFAKITARKLESQVFPHLPAGDEKTKLAVETVRRNLDIITMEGTRLTALISDVLDISVMESGHIEWKREGLDLAALVQRSIETTVPLFSASVELSAELELELPEVVGDPARVVQLLVNLISNAAKFTEEGSVEVRAYRVGDGVEISVSDTGTGIAEVDQEAIFDRFQQAGDTLGDKPRGTGLGLAICVQIAEAHGGTIRVESEVGRGSTFTLRLPGADSARP